jgi:hypothetical protein
MIDLEKNVEKPKLIEINMLMLYGQHSKRNDQFRDTPMRDQPNENKTKTSDFEVTKSISTTNNIQSSSKNRVK